MVRCQVIAALDGHLGDDAALARELIGEARAAGADGVKLIWRTAESRATGEVARFGDGPFRASLQEPQIPLDALMRLLDDMADVKIYLAPYDVCAAKQLTAARLAGWKVDPPMLTHLPLIEELAADGRPIVAGIACCTRTELNEAVSRLPADSTLVHTLPSGSTSEVLDIAHLVALRKYGYPVGYADGSLDGSAALMAAALGASLIEKPLVLNRATVSAQPAGLYPYALKAFVEQVRRLEQVLDGDGTRDPLPEELDLIEQDRVSIVASCAIPRGTILERGMLALKAPGSGLSARFLPVIEGRRTLYDIPQGTFLTFGVIEL